MAKVSAGAGLKFYCDCISSSTQSKNRDCKNGKSKQNGV